MKKILLLVLSLILCCALIACDSQAPTVPNVSDDDAGQTPSGDNNQTPSDGGQTTPSTDSNEPEWLNVATYNILHCMDYKAYAGSPSRVDIIPDKYVDFMEKYEIDILGLNEVDINCSRSMGWVKSEYCAEYSSNQPAYMAAKMTERTGVPYYWAFAPALDGCLDAAHSDYNDGKSMYGNAIVTRFPILATRKIQVAAHEIDPDNPKTQIGEALGSGNYYEQKGALIAELDVNGTVVTVISAHFGLVREEQDLMMDALISEINVIDTPVVLMGDFNSSYNSSNINRFNQILKPTTTGKLPATFITGSRIDYIYTSEDLVTKDLMSPPLSYSDHYPVIVKMAFKPTEG